jgi:hypothetical protein
MGADLPRWARGPFELIQHGVEHMDWGQDFDRRIALISFDNAIEIAITTYLRLHPAQRRGREFQKDRVDKWLHNYHAKMDFFHAYAQHRIADIETFHQEVIYFHSVRNDMYHSGKALVPEQSDLEGIRDAAIKIFSILFEVDEELLRQPAVSAPETIEIDEDHSLTAETNFLRHYIEFERKLRAHLVDLGIGEQQTRMTLRTMWERYVSYVGNVPSQYSEYIHQISAVRNQMVHGHGDYSYITHRELMGLLKKINELLEYISQNNLPR